jgi:regulator of protease activity HflC (stomatin/prohibitin superfamily)
MSEMFLIPSIALVFLFVYFISALNIIPEYERGVIFRLGRLLQEAKGPGVVFAFWPIDRIVRVDLRLVALDVPPQDVITRDNVTVSVNAVVYFRVLDPRLAIVEVEDFLYATSQLAQTTLRSVLGEVELDELLSKREKLNERLQDILDRQTDRWGIKVSLVEIKGVDLPQEMRRAMSRQAEAEREKRAKIIHADGEYQAAEKLVKAASAIAAEPVAIQLRYLQTLTEIGVEQNTTVVFPIPIQMMEGLSSLLGKEKVEVPVARPAVRSAEPVTVSRNENHSLQW